MKYDLVRYALEYFFKLLENISKENFTIYCFLHKDDDYYFNKKSKFENLYFTVPEFIFLLHEPGRNSSKMLIDNENCKMLLTLLKIPNFLDCELWFQYYMSKIFQCARGRLQQKLGTCFAVVIINLFIMNPTLRKALLHHLAFESSRDLKNYAIQPLNTLKKGDYEICFKDTVTSNYFYRLIYQSVCNKQKFKGELDREGDVIAPMTQSLFDYAAIKNEETDERIGKHPGSDFRLHIEKLFPFADDLLFYDNFTKDPVKRFLEKKWLLQNCLIRVRGIKTTDKKSHGHVMLGYLCNGVPKVYDSNGYFFNFNWVKILNDESTDNESDDYDRFVDILKQKYNYIDMSVKIKKIYVSQRLTDWISVNGKSDEQYCDEIRKGAITPENSYCAIL
jgi:hypothetical protein